MPDEPPVTWEQVVELARRVVAGGASGDPADAQRLAALVLEFQAQVIGRNNLGRPVQTLPPV
jgi:hypothetical protein